MVRKLKMEDIGRCSEIWSSSMEGAYLRPVLEREEFKRIVFENRNFDADASFVALRGEEVVGFIVSYCQKEFESDGYWHIAAPGWIGALAVDEAARGLGAGSRLLEAAEDVHRAKGRLLIFAGGGENAANFICGLEEGWSEAASFFKSKGYLFVRRTCFINCDPGKYEFPGSIKSRRSKLENEGFSFRKIHGDEENIIKRFYLEQGYSDSRASNLTEGSGECIAAMYKNRPAGLLRNIRVEKGRGGYSGITTLPEFRKKGIGKVMLATALEHVKKQGAFSMPLWTRPATYEKFYSGLGFVVEKNYDVYAKKLPQDLLSEDWIARYQDPR